VSRFRRRRQPRSSRLYDGSERVDHRGWPHQVNVAGRAEFDPRWIPRWLFDRDEGCDDRVGSRFEKSRTQLAIAEMAESAPANLRSFSRVYGRVAAGVRGR
jgi:hypothetical protein